MFKFIKDFWKAPEPTYWVCRIHHRVMAIHLAIEPNRHFCPHCLSEFLEAHFPVEKEVPHESRV